MNLTKTGSVGSNLSKFTNDPMKKHTAVIEQMQRTLELIESLISSKGKQLQPTEIEYFVKEISKIKKNISSTSQEITSKIASGELNTESSGTIQQRIENILSRANTIEQSFPNSTVQRSNSNNTINNNNNNTTNTLPSSSSQSQATISQEQTEQIEKNFNIFREEIEKCEKQRSENIKMTSTSEDALLEYLNEIEDLLSSNKISSHKLQTQFRDLENRIESLLSRKTESDSEEEEEARLKTEAQAKAEAEAKLRETMKANANLFNESVKELKNQTQDDSDQSQSSGGAAGPGEQKKFRRMETVTLVSEGEANEEDYEQAKSRLLSNITSQRLKYQSSSFDSGKNLPKHQSAEFPSEASQPITPPQIKERPKSDTVSNPEYEVAEKHRKKVMTQLLSEKNAYENDLKAKIGLKRIQFEEKMAKESTEQRLKQIESFQEWKLGQRAKRRQQIEQELSKQNEMIFFTGKESGTSRQSTWSSMRTETNSFDRKKSEPKKNAVSQLIKRISKSVHKRASQTIHRRRNSDVGRFSPDKTKP